MPRLRWPRHFLGLPLHPMLVHFPLVLWLCAPPLDAATLILGLRPWWGLMLGVTAGGVVIGLFALVTGLLDYIHLSETGSNDVRLASRHGVRTASVWCVMSLKLAIAVWLDAGLVVIVAVLVVDVLACALLLQGIYLGTRITYGRYAGR